MRDLTFAEVCRFIKEDEPTLIETADSLLTVVLLLSPLVFGLPMAAIEPALGLFALKNELLTRP
jgi:hypothetical protein